MYADAGFGFSPYSPHSDFSSFSFSPTPPPPLLPLLHYHHHYHHQQEQEQDQHTSPPPGPSIYDHPALPLTIDDHLGNMGQASLLSEYDLGEEGDLFKAPEPIIEEESLLSLDDPVAAAISMMSSGGGGEPSEMDESIKVDDPLLSEVLYECEKELMEKSAIEETISELLDVKIPMLQVEEVLVVPPVLAMENDKPPSSLDAADECSLQKSVSSGCLNSSDWMNGSVRPNFLDFQGLDFETAFGLRRAYSEGDIQNMGANTPRPANSGNVPTSCERLVTISDLKSEERKQKLSRYRKKKIKRNFGRKIKYACRKALADSQPRVRGRFAKMDDGDMLRPRK